MWRCIMFAQLFPQYLLNRNPIVPHQAVVRDGEVQSDVVWEAVRDLALRTEPIDWVRGSIWWDKQNRVYVENELCGVVFLVTKET